MSFLNKTLAVSISLSLCISHLAWADSASGQIENLEKSILTTQQQVDSELRKSAHILLRDINYTLKGDISGKLDGNFSQQSRFSSSAIGALLGAVVMGVLATGLGPLALAAPLALSDIGISAGIGAAAGGLAGVAAPEEVGKGNLQGQISGQVQGQGWDNLYQSKNFVVLNIDPRQLKLAENLKAKGLVLEPCSQKYIDFVRTLSESGRTMTDEKVASLLAQIESVRQNGEKLELEMASQPSQAQQTLISFLNRSNNWLGKKLSVVSVGQNINAQVEAGYIFDLNLIDDSNGKKIAPIKVFGMNYRDSVKQVAKELNELVVWRYRLPDGHRIARNEVVTSQDSYNVGYRSFGFSPFEVSVSPVTQVRLVSSSTQCESVNNIQQFVKDTSTSAEFLFHSVESDSAVLNGLKHNSIQILPTKANFGI